MTLFTKKNSRTPLFGLFAFCLLISMVSNAGIKVIPGVPGPISGQTNVCAFVATGQSVQYSISAVPGAELYLWTVPPTATIVSGQGTTSIMVNFSAGFTTAANKQLRVRAISQDGNSTDRILYLSSQQPSTPSSIIGTTNACIYIGTSGHATYTTARDASASGYIWGADPATTFVSHPNGPGANDTIIHVIFKNGFKTSPITVQAINNCGFSAARILTVSGIAPSTPGAITGPTNACPYMLPNGTAATYSINPVAGATGYTWTAPAGAVITHPNGSGSNDITITVQYPLGFTGGSISVIASSGCDDSSPRSLAITKLNPGTPGLITPIEQAICPDREYLYKLPSMPSNTNAINWTVPADAISFTGQGTATISVMYPATRISGIVTATGVNNCASSSTRQSVVNLNRCQVERPGASTGRSNGTSPVEAKSSVNGKGNSTENKQLSIDVSNNDMRLNIAPNPSKGDFKLQVFTPNKEVMSVKLLDLQGRELKKMNMVKGQSLIFGNDLNPGTYILEVSQGKNKRTEKLLKL